jgi:hypothetical protein
LAAAVVVVSALLLAACGRSHPAQAHHKPAAFTIFGTLWVYDSCAAMADDGYSDITAWPKSA